MVMAAVAHVLARRSRGCSLLDKHGGLWALVVSAAAADVPIDYSLREYASILYLEPRMKITIRAKKVRTNRILKSVSRRAAVSRRRRH